VRRRRVSEYAALRRLELELTRRRAAVTSSPNTSDLAFGSLLAGSSGSFESGAECLTAPPPRQASSVCSDDGGAPGDAPVAM